MGGEELALPVAECLCAGATGSGDWTSETSRSILRVKGQVLVKTDLGLNSGSVTY